MVNAAPSTITASTSPTRSGRGGRGPSERPIGCAGSDCPVPCVCVSWIAVRSSLMSRRSPRPPPVNVVSSVEVVAFGAVDDGLLGVLFHLQGELRLRLAEVLPLRQQLGRVRA